METIGPTVIIRDNTLKNTALLDVKLQDIEKSMTDNLSVVMSAICIPRSQQHTQPRVCNMCVMGLCFQLNVWSGAN
jgi:hypothetical protein